MANNQKFKRVTLEVTVKVPIAFNKAEVKKEVRSRINDECGYWTGKTNVNKDWVEMEIKATSLK